MLAHLEHISLFRGLREDELHALIPKAVTKTFPKNSNVVREGIVVSDEYFAFKPARDKSQYFTQIYKNRLVLKMINESADKARIICNLSVREQRPEDPPSSYWGWLPKNGSYFEMILWSRFALDFNYGLDASEKSGKGKAVNLHVEMVE